MSYNDDDDDDDDEDNRDEETWPVQRSYDQPRRQAICGKISFGIACFVGLSVIGIFGGAAMMAANANGGKLDEKSPAVLMLGLGVIVVLLLAVLGVGLGFGGLFERKRSKVLAILGVVFNGLVLLGVGVVMAIGVAISK